VSDEDEYFHKLDQEAKARLKARLDEEHAVQDHAARVALHRGRCGKCGGVMKARPFRGVEIDVCEECGSVLLDPGELQQLAGKDDSAVFSSFFSMFGTRRER
jgi:hypothetical protein